KFDLAERAVARDALLLDVGELATAVPYPRFQLVHLFFQLAALLANLLEAELAVAQLLARVVLRGDRRNHDQQTEQQQSPHVRSPAGGAARRQRWPVRRAPWRAPRSRSPTYRAASRAERGNGKADGRQ